MITMVSGRRRSNTSPRSLIRPGTRLISLPSLISRRAASSNMIVGEWLINPAPTISPIESS
jgi:hypothetical protein